MTPKTRSWPTCYHIKFGRCRSNRLDIGVGTKKVMRKPGPRSPGFWGIADPYKHATPPQLLSHQFSSLKFKPFGAPPKTGNAGAPPFGMGMWLTPRNVLLSHLCYHAKFGHSRLIHKSIIMEIRQKTVIPHISTFKVTQGHWNLHRLISYLWLPISDP